MITYSPLLRDMLYPNLVFFQLVPKVALAPLFVDLARIRQPVARRLRHLHQLLPGRHCSGGRLRGDRSRGFTAVSLADGVRMAVLCAGAFPVRIASDLQWLQGGDDDGGDRRHHR